MSARYASYAMHVTLEDSDAVRAALSDTSAAGDVETLCEAGEAVGLGLEAAALQG